MAPHDCRRLLLAQRDAGPVHVPDRSASAPGRTRCLADAAQEAGSPAGRVSKAGLRPDPPGASRPWTGLS